MYKQCRPSSSSGILEVAENRSVGSITSSAIILQLSPEKLQIIAFLRADYLEGNRVTRDFLREEFEAAAQTHDYVDGVVDIVLHVETALVREKESLRRRR